MGLSEAGSTRAWRRVRRAVLIRDGGRCWLCGGYGADSVDHIVPRAAGGTDAAANLAAAHGTCNSSRGAPAPVRAAPSRRW